MAKTKMPLSIESCLFHAFIVPQFIIKHPALFPGCGKLYIYIYIVTLLETTYFRYQKNATNFLKIAKILHFSLLIILKYVFFSFA